VPDQCQTTSSSCTVYNNSFCTIFFFINEFYFIK
jgi:hypothetical protein